MSVLERAIRELRVEVAEMRREKRLGAAHEAEGALELGADGQDRTCRSHAAAAAPRVRTRATGGSGRTLARSSPRSAGGSAGRVRGTRPRSRRAARAHRRRRRRSARRSDCRSSSRALLRSRRAGGGGAACTGSITPSQGLPGATASATVAPLRRRRSTIGRRRDSSSSALVRRRASASSSGRRVISANGLSSRCLRARSRATAASSAASHARCQPPRPLTATIAPLRSRSTASSSGSVSRGPQAAQQTRLGVEAPVGRVLVLAAAFGAERKARHRRRSPVVRDRADDREAGTTLRAVDERIAVPAVGRVVELAQAVVAGRGVRRNERRAPGPACSPRS